MKQYFKNLLAALLGNNPYQAECDELRRQMEKADKQVTSLQQLVENLRERIATKDKAIQQYIIRGGRAAGRAADSAREGVVTF